MEEYNKDQLDTNKLPKSEHSDIGTTEPIKEYSSYKKAKTTAKVTSLVITLIGASLVIGSFLTFAFVNNKITTKVDSFEITAGVTDVSYDIVISETKSDKLILKLHNSYVTMTRDLSSGETIGSFTQLKSNTQYTVSILENNILVKSEKILTLKENS